MAYAFRKCPTFNRWSPCSASLLSALAVSCRHQCPSLVDAQRLSLLGSFLRWLSSISDCWIEWFTPFAGIRHSANGHRAVFHCFLPWQCRVDAHPLGRWTHSAFCAFTFPTLALLHQRLLDRMVYTLRWYPVFNQWSPCSVSLHSDQAVSCRRLCSSPVDAQRLSRLWRSYAGSLPAVVAGSNGLCPSLVSGIQPMVTVQCFTAFCPGSVV